MGVISIDYNIFAKSMNYVSIFGMNSHNNFLFVSLKFYAF